MRWRDSYHPYALTTILFWSLAYVFTRLAVRHFSALALGVLRYLVASAALLAVVLILKLRPPSKRDSAWFLAAGMSGFFLYMITFNKGCELVTASTSSVMIATVPVITALLARFVYGEKLAAVQWLGTAVSFGGVVLLTVLRGDLSMNAGILWLLAAAVVLSVYNLLQRRLTRNYSAVQTSAYSIFAGTVMLMLFFPAAVPEMKTAPAIQWVYILILGVLSSALAYCTWAKAFEKAGKTSDVSSYMFLTPLVASVLAVLIAEEGIEFSTVIGGVVIMAGLFLFQLGGRKQRELTVIGD